MLVVVMLVSCREYRVLIGVSVFTPAGFEPITDDDPGSRRVDSCRFLLIPAKNRTPTGRPNS